MPNIVLAIKDYENHLSWEGHLQQRGLEEAGYTLCGYGYSDGCTAVPVLLDRYKPEIVVVSDPRDWHRTREESSSNDAHFDGYTALKDCDAYVAVVFKDAWAVQDWQARFHQDVGAKALITYASDAAVKRCAWEYVGNDRKLIQTYHSINSCVSDDFLMWQEAGRFRGIVTGARNANMYPLREQAFLDAYELGLATLPHPGYSNRNSGTYRYLGTLGQYCCHVATSNKWGFPMAKIIESVAMGCIPITDLPVSEVLPEIDGALFRVQECDQLLAAIDNAQKLWNLKERATWSGLCEYYSYQNIGARLARALEAARKGQ